MAPGMIDFYSLYRPAINMLLMWGAYLRALSPRSASHFALVARALLAARSAKPTLNSPRQGRFLRFTSSSHQDAVNVGHSYRRRLGMKYVSPGRSRLRAAQTSCAQRKPSILIAPGRAGLYSSYRQTLIGGRCVYLMAKPWEVGSGAVLMTKLWHF